MLEDAAAATAVMMRTGEPEYAPHLINRVTPFVQSTGKKQEGIIAVEIGGAVMIKVANQTATAPSLTSQPHKSK